MHECTWDGKVCVSAGVFESQGRASDSWELQLQTEAHFTACSRKLNYGPPQGQGSLLADELTLQNPRSQL